FNAVDAIKMGVLVLDNSPDVFVELRPTVSEKSSFPVLGRKDDVIEDLGVGRRTALAEDSTPPGLTVRRTSTTGFAAGRCPFAAPVATHIQALRAYPPRVKKDWLHLLHPTSLSTLFQNVPDQIQRLPGLSEMRSVQSHHRF